MIQNEEIPITNDLVLIGGGHSHLSLIMQLSTKPLKGNRITLISNEIDTPYSGMIPGFIEGVYSWRDSHIDLYKLCIKLNVRFIHSEATKVSALNREIFFKNRPKIKFDVLSINSGIQSNYINIKGAQKYCIPVKPISKLANNFLKEVSKTNSIAFIGGGAASVELALGLNKRFNTIKKKLKISIITGKNGLLSSFPTKTQKKSLDALKEAKINIIAKKEVIEVTKDKLIMSDNTILSVQKSILSTNAMAPEWIKNSDILLNQDGFITVNSSFQTNHEYIFAAGDIVDFNNENLKKTGVFAVRSGKPLAKSIKNYILYKSNFSYSFNKNYLALIGLSNGFTIATKYDFSYYSKFNNHLKKYIDQNFIKKFNNFSINKKFNLKKFISLILKIFNKKQKVIHVNKMQCKGCAAKVSYDTLMKSLPENITSTSEDAIRISNYPSLYQSIDMISAIVSDPFILGKIAANHAISDIISVNSKIISAMMILQLPLSKSKISSRDLEQILSGATEIFNLIDCPISGGHTMVGKDNDPVIGFAITGEKKINKYENKNRKIKINDALILTEKIGSGIIFAGINNDIIDSYHQTEVLKQMSNGNISFGNITEQINILSMTDITGFGLANHLLNLIKRDNGKTGLTIFPEQIPVFEGVKKAIAKKIRSSLFDNNFNAAKGNIIYGRDVRLIDEILYDPQTVGGLAFIIPKEEKNKQLQTLKENNIKFTEIGFVNDLENKIKIM
ncbi:MAG: selenide, water dikinase SelD [Candidatus Puniceispirillales bacterium]